MCEASEILLSAYCVDGIGNTTTGLGSRCLRLWSKGGRPLAPIGSGATIASRALSPGSNGRSLSV